MLGRPFWGRGYAREGAREALRYVQTVLHRLEVVSIIRPENEASIRVATALGARRGEQATPCTTSVSERMPDA